jgi:hypothetical protein
MATTDADSAPTELDSGMMIRRALFLLLLVGVTYYFLGVDFRGLSHAKGMDQAQIARQIASDKHYSTLVIRPLAYAQVDRQMKLTEGPGAAPSFMDGIPDTYHAPLNPILNSIPLGMFRSTWKMDAKQVLYTPDIIVAGVSMLLLLSSIGVSYLLVSRIFDARIGGVTALLLLLCEGLWRFSQSGLPQMLMLFLFSFATYFLYKAVENARAGRPVLLWMALTGAFFGLLAMSHWLAVWPFIGLVFFVAFYFQPRGVALLVLIGVFLLITMWWPLFNNMRYTGNPLGAGLYLFYAGMGGTADELTLMRDLEQTAGGLNFDGFIAKMVGNSVAQLSDLYNYMGGIIAAPLFFLALLHPFRRQEIADFRWCVLLMWLFAVVGMTLYGLKPFGDGPTEDRTDPNNLHVVFLPLMTGYGLAFLAVLWNRLDIPQHVPAVRNGHFILAVAISALPFVLQLPLRILRAMSGVDLARVHYPYYVPQALATMGKMVPANEAVVTDIPWAVAWYMNRAAVLLPKDKAQLETLREIGRERNQPVSALLLSQYSLGAPLTDATYRGTGLFEWREYLMLRPSTLIGKSREQVEAIMSSLQADMPIRNPAMTGGPGDSLYLFMTENPVARLETEGAAAP